MPNLSEFDPDGDPRNVSNRWTKWVHDFRAAMVSFKITSEKRQRALLRFYGGDELTDILESLNDTGAEDEIEPAIEVLTRYFTPARNCEEKGHGGHAQDKECSGHVRGHGGEIHHFTRCCGSSVQSVRPYTEGDKSNVKTDTDEKSAKNTYKRETMTGNNQNTHTGKETKAAQERKSPTRAVKQKKSPNREVTQTKSPTRKVKLKDSHQGDVKRNDSHKRDVNKINRKHVRKRVVDQNLHKRRDVNMINTEDEVKQETTAVHTVIWKINNVSAGKSVKKKQISRRKKGKERHSAKKSHVKYSIIAGDKVHVKGKEYKSDVEPPDIGNREEPEQVVIQPRHHHKSRPPNSYDYVAN